jgi:hypothetical protein
MRKGSTGWEPVASGWGLVDSRSGDPIDPTSALTDQAIEMTDWELQHFAVQVVREYLEKQGHEVTAHHGCPLIDPCLWFEGPHGLEWVVVRAVRYPERDAPTPANMERIAASCAQKSRRGNFASVAVASANDPIDAQSGSAAPLLRGGPMIVNFPGLVAVAG